MKLTILWSRLAGYTVSFFRELAARGCEIQLSHIAPGGHLRFEPFDVSFCREARELTEPISPEWGGTVRAFAPDAVLMSGWKFEGYMRIARECRSRGVPVVAAVDNPWRGDLRQRAACAAARWLLHPAIDALYVCGERQLQFARRLGFDKAFTGLYAADTARFDGLVALDRRPNRFLFVGRLVERKGIAELIAAYVQYRGRVANPMELLIAGRGPMASACEGVEGVQLCGFLHPDGLPDYFAQGQCLILPSWLEHWGVVLHEAAAAGLPLIASEACGASTAYVRDGSNGYLVLPRVESIAAALVAFHGTDDARRARMSEQSIALARSWTPSLQAQHFLHQIRGFCKTGSRP